jgi:hypothetical protein
MNLQFSVRSALQYGSVGYSAPLELPRSAPEKTNYSDQPHASFHTTLTASAGSQTSTIALHQLTVSFAYSYRKSSEVYRQYLFKIKDNNALVLPVHVYHTSYT